MKNDIETARHLAENGVPIFLAKPAKEFPKGGSDGRGYHLPKQWQQTKADPSILDDYEPGMAVCAVMGHTVDAVDKDPRNGGILPEHLQPMVYGIQSTPSGGTHDLVAHLGVRSRDGILAGIDVKAGLSESGEGVGFIFIAPTERPVHGSQEVKKYEWITPPDLDILHLLGERENSGSALSNEIQDARIIGSDGRPSYDGPAYDDLEEGKRVQARQAQDDRILSWREMLLSANSWEEGHRDYKGRGWEGLTRDFAWSIASMVANPWMPMTEEQAHDVYDETLPEFLAATPECSGKFYSGLTDKAASRPTEQPPWADFEPISVEVAQTHQLPTDLDDANMVDWLMNTGLGRRWAWSPGIGWMHWDGKRWENSSLEAIREELRQIVLAFNVRAQDAGMDKDYMKQARSLRSASRVFSLSNYIRGKHIIEPDRFDNHPNLLNVQNGVIDLETGELLPHNPDLMLSKISETEYRPNAKHADLEKIKTALPKEVMSWMQRRFGQAATGHPTSDDILPISQGLGSNGKTTLIAAVRGALGEHAVTVPDRVLQARPSDHPTELMELKGARLALIDETPEAGHLNVQRIKSVLGSETISARKISQDTVTWKPTHSLFVNTNYVPMIRETDDGTWRRLALVKFDRKFQQIDSFRSRIENGSPSFRSAALAWVVEGAKAWFDDGRNMGPLPDKVALDTSEWRYDSDVVTEFVEQNLVFDPKACVVSTELYETVINWLTSRRRNPWSDQLFASRFEGSGVLREQEVQKKRINSKTTTLEIDLKNPGSPIPGFPTVWSGVRWSDDSKMFS